MNPAPDAATLSPEERLKKLEDRLQKVKKKPKDKWDKFQSVSGIVSGILVAAAGILLTGSVNRALQERQFQFSSAKDMEELLMKLNDPKNPIENKESTALVLAAFGKYAIQPLINQIQSGDVNRSIAAEDGLRAIGQSDPENTCKDLTRVLENRTRLFAWHTHLAAIRVIRDTDCRKAAPMLEQYRRRLKEPERYRLLVREDPAPSAENIDRLQKEIDYALQILGQPSGSNR